MKSVKADVWLGICIIVGALVFLYADSQLSSVNIGGRLGPKAFPALVGIGLLCSGLLLLRETWNKRGEQPPRPHDAARPAGQPASQPASQSGSQPGLQPGLQPASQPVAQPDTQVSASGTESQPLTLVLVAMVVWTAFYYFCFERVGYLIATTVFLLGLLSYFHRGHYLANCVIAVGFALVIDGLFSYLLNVPLPAGFLSI